MTDDNEKSLNEAFNRNVEILNHFGNEALKAILLLNGGASVASLAFIGTLAVNKSTSAFSPVALGPMLGFFGVGAGLAVIAYSLNYLILAVSLYFSPKAEWPLRVATIVTAAAALICYFAGLWQAGKVFLG